MIYIECKADYALVTSITGFPRKDIVHELNKGNICNQLRRQSNSVGLIDEDPSGGQPPYVKKARVENALFSAS